MALAAPAAQLNPTALTATKLYTAPASTLTTAHVVVANRSTVQTTFRISKRIAGAGADDKQYGAYDTPINGNDVYQSPKMVLNATDEIWVYATDATLSFSLEGLEFVPA
jgi:hypothetical protein